MRKKERLSLASKAGVENKRDASAKYRELAKKAGWAEALARKVERKGERLLAAGRCERCWHSRTGKVCICGKIDVLPFSSHMTFFPVRFRSSSGWVTCALT